MSAGSLVAPCNFPALSSSDYLGDWATREEDYLARVLLEEMESVSANTRRLLDEGKSLAESQYVLVVGELVNQKRVHPRVLQAFE